MIIHFCYKNSLLFQMFLLFLLLVLPAPGFEPLNLGLLVNCCTTVPKKSFFNFLYFLLSTDQGKAIVFRRHDIQHNDTLHNNTLPSILILIANMLIVAMLSAAMHNVAVRPVVVI
jgi:hypothetical protein